MECLKAEGVDVVFGLPGGANIPTYDALFDAGHPPRPRAPRGRRRPRRRGLREGDRQGRRLPGHQRPGRHQRRHADPGRDDGLGPDRVHHRPGAHGPAGDRRLPGGRRARHHHAGRQALVHDPAPAGDPARAARGVLPRALGPPGADRGRHPDRPLARGHPVRAGHRPAPARLPADHRGQRQADPPGGQGAGGVAPAGALRRRRRGQRQRVGRAGRARDGGPLPDHLHAHGPGRLPGAPRAVAGHAGHARDPHRQLRDGRGRPHLRDRGALRRPRHRQAQRVRAAGEVHPHRHRPGRDLQERAGPHPDRGRREEHPGQAGGRVPRAGDRQRDGWTSGGSASTAGSSAIRCATRSPRRPRSSRST